MNLQSRLCILNLLQQVCVLSIDSRFEVFRPSLSLICLLFQGAQPRCQLSANISSVGAYASVLTLLPLLRRLHHLDSQKGSLPQCILPDLGDHLLVAPPFLADFCLFG